MAGRRATTCCLLLSTLAACASPPRDAAGANAGLDPRLVPFVGRYAGTLRIHSERGVETVPMALDVEPASAERLRWVMKYGADGGDVRDYQLILDDAATGRCRVDERNGIELPGRLLDGELVTVFSVQEKTLVARYAATAAGIEFGIESFVAGAGAPTGHGVTTHAPVLVQRASLARRR
jgi:hypothetical protein